MGFRFYRRVHLFPGVSMNVSRSGPSLTVGRRGVHLTVGPRGVTRTVGLPGTGLYYTSRAGYHTGYHSAKSDMAPTPDEQVAADHRVGRTILVVAVIVVLSVLLLAF